MAIKSWSVSCNIFIFLVITVSCSLLLNLSAASVNDNRKEYIVYMGDKIKDDHLSVSSFHINMLQTVIIDIDPRPYLLYSYKKSFNGFVARLTEVEKIKIEGMNGVVSVFPNEICHLHTTRSWDFMGFSQQVQRTSVESDIIIGVIDTGIWPESDSFSDKGFSPPPSKWKGACETANFTCNNKIIGARYYRSNGMYPSGDLQSARDSSGHGTHTSSTAAGGLVSMASLMGLELGTARGGVPSARIAVYKVCWSDGCYDADILAAFEDAIADGVDIISLSVGTKKPRDYFSSPISIGTFHAMKAGIFASTSAGNNGPKLANITNFAPWSLSVAASTIDRKLTTKLQLGNNMSIEGVSINTFDMNLAGMYPIVYAGAVPNITAYYTGSTSRFCDENSMDSNIVKGKIVVCDAMNNGQGALSAGAAGMVMRDNGAKDTADSYPIPTTYLGINDGASVFAYLNSTKTPVATIFKSNQVKDTLAPYVVSFSSRGPNPFTSNILSPDIAAPGNEILAAYSPIAPVSGIQGDMRRASYNILSGTSMACPHATAVAAYIKSFHPSWSPAAIKSAIMTTAYPLSVTTSPDAEFAYGAGHINPLRAIDPGLVYDAGLKDYIDFLCAQGYSTPMLQVVTGDNNTCTEATTSNVWDLNLPSLTLATVPLRPFRRMFKRIVTNVGLPVSTYKATLSYVEGVSIRVEPNVLSFTSLGQTLSYAVNVEGVIDRTRVSASLVWSDGKHQVRSPIVVYAL